MLYLPYRTQEAGRADPCPGDPLTRIRSAGSPRGSTRSLMERQASSGQKEDRRARRWARTGILRAFGRTGRKQPRGVGAGSGPFLGNRQTHTPTGQAHAFFLPLGHREGHTGRTVLEGNSRELLGRVDLFSIPGPPLPGRLVRHGLILRGLLGLRPDPGGFLRERRSLSSPRP